MSAIGTCISNVIEDAIKLYISESYFRAARSTLLLELRDQATGVGQTVRTCNSSGSHQTRSRIVLCRRS